MGIRHIETRNGLSDVENIANVPECEFLVNEKTKQVLLLSAAGYTSKTMADRLNMSPIGIHEIYRDKIYPRLGASNQETAVLRAVELGVFSLSQATMNFDWEKREMLSLNEFNVIVYLLRNPTSTFEYITTKYELHPHTVHHAVRRAKDKLNVYTLPQLQLITLTAVAMQVRLDYPTRPGENEDVRSALAVTERVPYPYPQEWSDWV